MGSPDFSKRGRESSGDGSNRASNPVSDTAVVALAGRRIDAEDADPPRFSSNNIPEVRKRLARLFEQEEALALVSSAACGSDLIGLEEAERIHIRRRIVLPFSREKFRATSVVDRPGEWGASFDHLVDLAEEDGDIIMLEQGEDADAAYAAAITDAPRRSAVTTPCAAIAAYRCRSWCWSTAAPPPLRKS